MNDIFNKDQNWEDYENKPFTFINSDKDEIECILAGFEYDVGVTIVDANNHDNIRFCVVPFEGINCEGYTYENYFEMVINGIIAKYFDSSHLLTNHESQGRLASICQFRR